MTILRKPLYQKFLRRVFILLYIAGILTLILSDIGDPSPVFEDLPISNESIDRIGFLDQSEEAITGYMQFSAQYHLAPLLLVHTDPYCCRYLITNDIEHLSGGYLRVNEFSEGWYLVEFDDE